MINNDINFVMIEFVKDRALVPSWICRRVARATHQSARRKARPTLRRQPITTTGATSATPATKVVPATPVTSVTTHYTTHYTRPGTTTTPTRYPTTTTCTTQRPPRRSTVTSTTKMTTTMMINTVIISSCVIFLLAWVHFEIPISSVLGLIIRNIINIVLSIIQFHSLSLSLFIDLVHFIEIYYWFIIDLFVVIVEVNFPSVANQQVAFWLSISNWNWFRGRRKEKKRREEKRREEVAGGRRRATRRGVANWISTSSPSLLIGLLIDWSASLIFWTVVRANWIGSQLHSPLHLIAIYCRHLLSNNFVCLNEISNQIKRYYTKC